MGEMFTFPTRESKDVENIYRREFGYVICPHKVYLPNQHCEECAVRESKKLALVMRAEQVCGVCGYTRREHADNYWNEHNRA